MKYIVTKESKAFKEVAPEVKGIKNPITLGIKIYGKKDKDTLDAEYKKVSYSKDYEIAQALLKQHEELGDKTSEEFYDIRETMLEDIKRLSEAFVENLNAFYKKQVLFIKNASITVADDTGTESVVVIKDTRVVEPIESLWANSSECLAVLLDYYFEEDAYKDSLSSTISSTIFNYSLKKEEKLKN